ncbi:MAG TPA: nucleoside transporter C-terminal domain-containing protein, partial [Thermoanaerobaculia bacterium]|nr:nucleoside transporter C-terminal domain-containing protein [Thermoanaerobaculia bacterium]
AGPMDDVGSKTGLPLRGFIFAFKVLPIIIFICAFFSLLYYFGIIQVVVKAMAWVMQKSTKVSGAEALCVAANVFIGQTEAPVLIAPYIAAMTTSELLTMMTGGMAHVSGAVMLAYVTMGAPLKYLITASVMAAPGTFLIAKILWPETEEPVTMGTVRMKVEKANVNFIDAAASGASQGMTLVLNISAMLIAFVALIAMLNGFLGWVGHFWGNPTFSLQEIFGYVLGPLAFILGVPRQDTAIVGNLIANKTVINEFFAFSMMKDVVGQLSEKGKLIATFALCGFANFSSIGIQIGGIGGLAPTRKSDLARLGFRALLAGSLVSFMTAAMAGLIWEMGAPVQ